MSPKIFVSWAAVSSEQQVKTRRQTSTELVEEEKISLQSQLRSNHEHCEMHGGRILMDLVVDGQSRDIVLLEDARNDVTGYMVTDGVQKSCHPYAELHRLIQQKAFDVLIFLNHSRLGRDAALSMAVLRLCHRAGIVTYSVESPPVSLDAPAMNHSESLMDAIKSVGAQQEISELKRRHTVGMIGRVRRGDFPSRIPWPWLARYTESGKYTIEIDEQGREVLLLFKELYLVRRASIRQIAADFANRGFVPAGGGSWKAHHVYKIIVNCWRYAGYNEINRRTLTGREHVRAKSRWPAVWSEDDAQAIEDERYRRYKGRGSIYSRHRFSLVVYCIECGARMTAAYTYNIRNGKRYDREVFRCAIKHDSGRQIMAWRIEERLRQSVEKLQGIADLSQVLPTLEDRTSLLQSQVAKLEKAIADLRQQIDRADDALVRGAMTASRHQRQVDRIEMQIQDKQNEMELVSRSLRTERKAGNRLSRLEEVRDFGMAYFDMDDIATANKWFIDHFRVWVRGGRVVDVEAL